MPIANKIAPKSVQSETAWTLSSIATLKGLKWWQQIQGGLTTIVMLTALYLFSELGVEGEENGNLAMVGASGLGCMLLTILINLTMLNRATTEHHAQRQPSELELSHEIQSKRKSSTSEIEENAIALALL